MRQERYLIQDVIEKCVNSGLFSETSEPYFTWSGCEYCNDGKGATVSDYKGYINLRQAKETDGYYEFRLCSECLNKLYYGE